MKTLTNYERYIRRKGIKANPKTAVPKCDVTIESIPALEGLVVKSLAERKLIQVGDDKSEEKKNVD